MGARSTAVGVVILLLAITHPSEADVRNTNWNDLIDANYSACVGQITSLREEHMPEHDLVIVATVKLKTNVAGTCPDLFELRSTDIREVLERPDRLGAQYLLFLQAPMPTSQGVPAYKILHRLAWERHLGWDCWGKSFFYYSPAYVNFPDQLHSRRCVSQALPLGGTVQHEENILLEDILLSQLKNPSIRR